MGAASQQRYGNLRLRDAIVLGRLAIPGAIGGVAIVNAIPERTVEVLFALLMLYVASQMVRRALAGPERAESVIEAEPVLERALDRRVQRVEAVERERLGRAEAPASAPPPARGGSGRSAPSARRRSASSAGMRAARSSSSRSPSST